MENIVSKYHGPTNYRGSRIIVSSKYGRITKSWDYGLDREENHKQAIQEFIAKFFPSWKTEIELQCIYTPDGYVCGIPQFAITIEMSNNE